MVERMDNVKVTLADGSESLLGDIRRKTESGGVRVYFGLKKKQALNQIMQARGHLVVSVVGRSAYAGRGAAIFGETV